MRIVSLLASGTEIVCALGAGDWLVGRSHECDNPEWVRALPRCSEPAFYICGSSREIDAEVNRRIRAGEPLYRLDLDLIRELAPDVLITQTHCDVCAVTPTDVNQSGCGDLALKVLPFAAGTLAGIYSDIRNTATAIGIPEKGDELVNRLDTELAGIKAACAACSRPSVVVLEWTDPLFAMGNWGPELVNTANGELLIGNAGEYSRKISFDELRTADPEFLVIAPCGFRLDRALEERAVLENHRGWTSLRAVRERKVAIADGNLYFNRSGVTVASTAAILADILHDNIVGFTAERAAWQWLYT